MFPVVVAARQPVNKVLNSRVGVRIWAILTHTEEVGGANPPSHSAGVVNRGRDNGFWIYGDDIPAPSDWSAVPWRCIFAQLGRNSLPTSQMRTKLLSQIHRGRDLCVVILQSDITEFRDRIRWEYFSSRNTISSQGWRGSG